MTTIRAEFEQKGFDEAQYALFYARNKDMHIRKRLQTILLYHQQTKVARIMLLLSLSESTVRKYISVYTEKGFAVLCEKTKQDKKGRLTKKEEALFKDVLLHKKPCEVDLSGNIWTGDIMRQYVKKTFGVIYHSGIYSLLKRLGLTHQKAHADYGNAQLADQQAFLADLETTVLQADEHTAVLFFDEFSVCEKPTSYYGWAEKNTRPTFTTNEKKQRV